MNLQHLALLPLLGATLSFTALAAPAGAAAATDGWWASFQDMFSTDAVLVGRQMLLSLLLFLGGWLVAKVISFGVYRLLCRTTLDNRIAARLRLGALTDERATAGPAAPNQLERSIANVVFYVLMLLVLVGVLQFAGLSQAAGPIQGLVDTVVQAFPLIGKAVLILVIAYFAGQILRRLVRGALTVLRVDDRFAELGGADPSPDAIPRRPFSRTAGDIVFWLVMLAGLAGAFDALRITPISEPLRNALDRVIAVLPSLASAGLIMLAGYVLGRIVRVLVHNVLDSLGFNRLLDRLGLARLFGATRPSAVIALVAMAFILIQAGIAALNEIGLVTLSGPLTAMMGRFWLMLPSLVVSALIVVIGVFVGRLLRNLVAAALRNLGFNALARRLGFPAIAPRPDRLGEPNELAGFAVQVVVILLALAQAFDNLQLHAWTLHITAAISYLLQHVLVAVVVLGVGLGVSNYVRALVQARGLDPQNRWLAEFARYAVLVLAVTMAIHQLAVAPAFVLLAFGLLFGGLCLAAALAFGLGARDVAGELVRRGLEQAQSTPPVPSTPGTLVPPASAPPASTPPGRATDPFPRTPNR